MILILMLVIIRGVSASDEPLSPELLTGLTRSGIRLTESRRQVLEALAKEPDDATAQQVHARLRAAGRTTGLATVYRTLAILSEHGVIDALAHRPGETCYRLCSAGHHHHLVCSSCHRVVELEGCDLGSWLEKSAATHGFVATEHRLDVIGICSTCRAAATAAA
jgi:Fur family ferric uptake transcriptional regulator